MFMYASLTTRMQHYLSRLSKHAAKAPISKKQLLDCVCFVTLRNSYFVRPAAQDRINFRLTISEIPSLLSPRPVQCAWLALCIVLYELSKSDTLDFTKQH